jgi:rare lipoprotein A
MKRFLFLLLLAGCAGTPPSETPDSAPAQSSGDARRPGGYYKDDGPGDKAPDNLAAIPDAEPRAEALSRFANRPYEVFGKRYVPLASVQPFRQRGLASWYGKRFHGQKTSSGERYDMYAMTAAHKTLPIPSYARVTRVATGRSVIVRINDRGPFHEGRIIDLSYAAAYRLGIIGTGSGEVEVEAIVPGAPATSESAAAESVPVAAAAVQPIATAPLKAEPLAPEAVPASGVFLQVGAFSSRDNAEKLRARLPSSEAPGELVQLDSLWRVQLGPYGSQDEARGAAERLEPALGLKPLVVVR